MISGRIFWRIPVEIGRFDAAARKPPVFRANPHPPPRAQSQIMCVGTFDLAFVSMTVRSVSNNLRRDTPIVSANLRRSAPLIARRTGYDCAPLQVSGSAQWRPVRGSNPCYQRERFANIVRSRPDSSKLIAKSWCFRPYQSGCVRSRLCRMNAARQIGRVACLARPETNGWIPEQHGCG